MLRKNWTTTRPARARPFAPRRPPLGDQEVGQHQDDERRDGQEGDVQLVEGQLGHHERREAVGQPAEEGGRRPPDPPAQQQEHGQRRQHRRQGQGHVHGRHRAPQPGDRGQHDTEGHHAGVVEEVDPPRVEEPRRVEDVVPVGQGEGRPPEVPEEPGGVATAAGGHRRRVRGPRHPTTARRRAPGTPAAAAHNPRRPPAPWRECPSTGAGTAPVTAAGSDTDGRLMVQGCGRRTAAPRRHVGSGLNCMVVNERLSAEVGQRPRQRQRRGDGVQVGGQRVAAQGRPGGGHRRRRRAAGHRRRPGHAEAGEHPRRPDQLLVARPGVVGHGGVAADRVGQRVRVVDVDVGAGQVADDPDGRQVDGQGERQRRPGRTGGRRVDGGERVGDDQQALVAGRHLVGHAGEDGPGPTGQGPGVVAGRHRVGVAGGADPAVALVGDEDGLGGEPGDGRRTNRSQPRQTTRPRGDAQRRHHEDGPQ